MKAHGLKHDTGGAAVVVRDDRNRGFGLRPAYGLRQIDIDDGFTVTIPLPGMGIRFPIGS